MNRIGANAQQSLFHLSDAEGTNFASAIQKLTPVERQELFYAAAEHGVLGIVLQNMQQDSPENHGVPNLILRRWRADMVKSVRLRQHGQRIMQALVDAQVPGTVFKGMDFAQHLYPVAALRSWRDIDLLVPKEQWNAAGEVLDALGYEMGPRLWSKYSTEDYGDQSWHYRSNPDIVVELHWNLIRNPSLRRRASVTFKDLDWLPTTKENAWHEMSPASRALIAAVHSTYTHQFDRLLLLCDLRQACRRMERQSDSSVLRDLANRTGTRAALDLALLATAKLFQDEQVEMVRRAVGTQRGTKLAARLVSREMLLSDSRWPEARRVLVREWLKRAA